ncbi:hypothetical protein CO670_28995 [Rhizobium sp. J15]|nr:hypothetical protein CO670_28995 [Rhizobium sp. J15]
MKIMGSDIGMAIAAIIADSAARRDLHHVLGRVFGGKILAVGQGAQPCGYGFRCGPPAATLKHVCNRLPAMLKIVISAT